MRLGLRPEPFGDRLRSAMDSRGPLCVGIDPHPGLLASWGLSDDVRGLRAFSLRVVEALAGQVAALKPQAAFYERHGSAGVAVLEEVIATARQAGTLTIVDAKRGDIGSTMQGYADAFLTEGSPLAGDAVTLSPYLGAGSLAPALESALAHGRGVFVLALTSNPEGASVQHARLPDGRSVAGAVVDAVAAANRSEAERWPTPPTLGSVGLVVGATIGTAAADLGIDLASVRGPFLAPGVGAQGAGPAQLRAVFGACRGEVLASTSRAVLAAGPHSADLLRAARLAGDEARIALD